MARRSPRLKRHAREMRRHPTRAEDRLWSWLRDRRFDGIKFRRQVPIGRYIADFYCADLKLVVELDGAHHRLPGMDEHDDERSLNLSGRGICVLRIPNELLIRDSVMVGEMIHAAVDRLTSRGIDGPPHPPSASSPPCAGEKALDGKQPARNADDQPGLAVDPHPYRRATRPPNR